MAVERIEASLSRMDQMPRDLLDVQRIEAGHGLVLRPVEADLVQIVHGVAEEHAAQAIDRVVVRGEAEVLGKWGVMELHRAISNLVGNALKYGPRDGQVTVTVTQHEG
jgi:signal transduction histidine kinase